METEGFPTRSFNYHNLSFTLNNCCGTKFYGALGKYSSRVKNSNSIITKVNREEEIEQFWELHIAVNCYWHLIYYRAICTSKVSLSSRPENCFLFFFFINFKRKKNFFFWLISWGVGAGGWNGRKEYINKVTGNKQFLLFSLNVN